MKTKKQTKTNEQKNPHDNSLGIVAVRLAYLGCLMSNLWQMGFVKIRLMKRITDVP